MKPNESLLLRVLHSARGKSLSVDDVIERAHLGPGTYSTVKQQLRDLVRDGKVEQDGKRFRIVIVDETPAAPIATASASVHEKPQKMAGNGVPALPPSVLPQRPKDGEAVGTLTIARGGFGFVASLHGGDDVFVPPHLIDVAMDGDLVKVRVGPGREGKPAAQSLVLVERRRSLSIGTYRVSNGGGRKQAWVEPRDEKVGHRIQVKPVDFAQDGEVVRVQLGDRVRGYDGVEQAGAVLSRVGLPGDADVEVLETAYAHGFSDQFPADTLAAANEVPETVQPEHRASRRDLTTLDLVTIDGEDARDFDDAVFVERTGHGFRLVVAIADVTAYVTPGGALDREAMRRATSVYFPGHVLPMLPERLSNGICSLNPHVERLCMVADMALDSTGKPLHEEVYPAVMKSRARCTYTQVAKLLEGEAVPALDHVAPMLQLAGQLARNMTAFRMGRGAIDFDIREAHVVLAADGSPAAIVRRARNAAHRLVEEFMLAANEAVARYFEARELPTVFRVHADPDPERLEQFRALARIYGHDVKADEAGKVSAAELNAFLARIDGKPEQRALNQLLLRSMMRAVYSSENVGHYGLAAESYLHFTSPIRRYPDLIVHRLLKEHWARAGRIPSGEQREKQAGELEALAIHCSERERASTEAERDIDAYYAARLVKDRVGEHFRGVVAGVAEFGLFIELEDPAVEGLIPAEAVGGGELDAERHRVRIGARTLGVGDTVDVELVAVDVLQRRIQLAFAHEAGRVVSTEKKLETWAQAKESSRPRPAMEAWRLAAKKKGKARLGGSGGGRGGPSRGHESRDERSGRGQHDGGRPHHGAGAKKAGAQKQGGHKSGGHHAGGHTSRGGGQSGGKGGGGGGRGGGKGGRGR